MWLEHPGQGETSFHDWWRERKVYGKEVPSDTDTRDMSSSAMSSSRLSEEDEEGNV
jgi:hypothetical protein